MLAILTTHPIQYQVPLWQALAKEGKIPFEVWYLSDHGIKPTHDPEFGKSFSWDIEMLRGYPYQFLKINHHGEVNHFWQLCPGKSFGKRFREKGVKALLIQGWQVLAYWQAVWQARAARVSVWVRGESSDLAPLPEWRKFSKRIFLRPFLRRIDHFLYIGEASRRFYEQYGVTQERLHPAPYCVDNERFARQAEMLLPERAQIRSKWNIPENAFCVLFAGKFIPKKRPLDLVYAACSPSLKEKGRPIHLLFAGSGELGSKLRQVCHVVFDTESFPQTTFQQIRCECNRPHASFVGFLNQTEISKAYVAADCLVLPSDYRETWGLVVNEAMASGIPCVVSDACGSCEDLIAPLNPRLRFPMGNIRALADALNFVGDTPFSRHIFQEQAARFSIKNSVATIQNLYSENGR